MDSGDNAVLYAAEAGPDRDRGAGISVSGTQCAQCLGDTAHSWVVCDNFLAMRVE